MKTKNIAYFAAIVIVFLALLSCNSNSSKSTEKVELDGIRGIWISADDAKNEVQISATEWADVYEGKVLSKSKYSLGDTCLDVLSTQKNEFGKAQGKYLTVFQGQDKYCYFVVKIEAYYLELSVAGRGNTMKFKRKIQ